MQRSTQPTETKDSQIGGSGIKTRPTKDLFNLNTNLNSDEFSTTQPKSARDNNSLNSSLNKGQAPVGKQFTLPQTSQTPKGSLPKGKREES